MGNYCFFSYFNLTHSIRPCLLIWVNLIILISLNLIILLFWRFLFNYLFMSLSWWLSNFFEKVVELIEKSNLFLIQLSMKFFIFRSKIRLLRSRPDRRTRSIVRKHKFLFFFVYFLSFRVSLSNWFLVFRFLKFDSFCYF